MAPFNRGLWAAAVGAALLLAAALSLALRAPPPPPPPLSPSAASAPASAARGCEAPRDAWLFVAAAFCQQGQRMPGAWSVRVLCVCAHLAALVLAAAHSGALISALSAGSPRLPFYSLKAALDDPSTRFIISFNTTFYDRLQQQHSEGSEWTRLVGRLEAAPRSTHELDSLRQTCARARAVALLSTEAFPLFARYLECDVTQIPLASTRNPMAFAFAQGNPYAALFSYCIRRMRRTGVLARVVHLYWPRSLPSLEEQRHPSVRLNDVVPVFAALLAGALLAFVLLAAERLFFFRRRRTSLHWNYVYRGDASRVCAVQPAVTS